MLFDPTNARGERTGEQMNGALILEPATPRGAAHDGTKAVSDVRLVDGQSKQVSICVRRRAVNAGTLAGHVAGVRLRAIMSRECSERVNVMSVVVRNSILTFT